MWFWPNLQRQEYLCDVDLALDGDLWNDVSIQRRLHRHLLNNKQHIRLNEGTNKHSQQEQETSD